MNLIPNKKVIKTEKFPIVDEESKLETKLPNNSKQQNGAHHNTAVFNIQVFFQTE